MKKKQKSLKYRSEQELSYLSDFREHVNFSFHHSQTNCFFHLEIKTSRQIFYIVKFFFNSFRVSVIGTVVFFFFFTIYRRLSDYFFIFSSPPLIYKNDLYTNEHPKSNINNMPVNIFLSVLFSFL